MTPACLTGAAEKRHTHASTNVPWALLHRAPAFGAGANRTFSSVWSSNRRGRELTFTPSRRELGLGIAMAMAIPSLIVGAGAVQATDAKLRIHRHDAARPFPVNAYIVEGNDGLVVLAAGWDLPIVALAAVDDVVRRDDAAKDALSAPLFGAEWPRNRGFASQRVRDGDRLDYGGGLAFTVMDIGPAESLHDSVWILDSERPIAFSGDLVYPLTHCYMVDGQIDRWRRATERLQSELAEETLLYVGHGPPPLALLSWQRLYLNRFEEALRATDWRDPDAATANVVRVMRAFVPNEQLLFFLEYSIRPNARRLGLL